MYLDNQPTGKRLYAFFTNASPLSNWFIAPFTCRGIEFNCVEQYMMWSKAMLFGDRGTAKAIMATPEPKAHKRLGREVKNYDDPAWKFAAPAFVREALVAKFSQNQVCYDELMRAKGCLLVEASPYDELWGAGLGSKDERLIRQRPEEWPGTNRLGIMMTALLESFLNVHLREAGNA